MIRNGARGRRTAFREMNREDSRKTEAGRTKPMEMIHIRTVVLRTAAIRTILTRITAIRMELTRMDITTISRASRFRRALTRALR